MNLSQLSQLLKALTCEELEQTEAMCRAIRNERWQERVRRHEGETLPSKFKTQNSELIPEGAA